MAAVHLAALPLLPLHCCCCVRCALSPLQALLALPVQVLQLTALHAPCCPRLQELPEPQLDAETRAAFDLAYENIAAFHRAQQVGGEQDRAGCTVAAAVHV